MKQIVCGASSTVKTHRSLNMAASYKGTVLYYSAGCRADSWYMSYEPELFEGYTVSSDGCMPEYGEKLFIRPKERSGELLLDSFRMAAGELKGEMLLVIDDNAWLKAGNKRRMFSELSRSRADIIINISYPEDLLPAIWCMAQSIEYAGLWEILVPCGRHAFKAGDWSDILGAGRLAAV